MPAESVHEVSCHDVADLLPRWVDGEADDPRLVHHLESCLRCQWELAQYRRLLRALRRLRTEVIEPGPGLLADILARIAEVERARIAEVERGGARSRLSGRRVAYVGGIAAATAAGAAGVIVRASRARARGARVPLAG